MKKPRTYSFADSAVSGRNVSSLDRIDSVINWQSIDSVISVYYKVGSTEAGRYGYSGLLLFKMLLLGVWYNLSDRKLEAAVADRISFLRFVGLGLEDQVPDHTRLCNFRKALALAPGGIEALLNEVNRQFQQHNLLLTDGVLIDATITESARKAPQAGGAGDAEAAHLTKGAEHYYGYKAHVATDKKGLVLAVETTPANVHDSQVFEPLLDVAAPHAIVVADKGYASLHNTTLLAKRKLKDGIMHKGYRNTPITQAQKEENKALQAIRYPIERTFGGIKAWFGSGRHRYLGLTKAHYFHQINAICYNLWRLPALMNPAV